MLKSRALISSLQVIDLYDCVLSTVVPKCEWSSFQSSRLYKSCIIYIIRKIYAIHIDTSAAVWTNLPSQNSEIMHFKKFQNSAFYDIDILSISFTFS